LKENEMIKVSASKFCIKKKGLDRDGIGQFKLFRNIVENEKVDLDERLLKKKLEQAKTQFIVDRYVSGNEAHMIADKAKLDYMLALDSPSVLTTPLSDTSFTTPPLDTFFTTPPPNTSLTIPGNKANTVLNRNQKDKPITGSKRKYPNKESTLSTPSTPPNKLTAEEKATLRYGVSRVIDLSAHMRVWFTETERQDMMKDHEKILKVPELTKDINEFIAKVEKSFCPLSQSASYERGRKCDVRFLSHTGIDLGEWEFSAQATPTKAIEDHLTDIQTGIIKVPYLQIAGVFGQLLVEDLVNGFYVVYPEPIFEIPTRLNHIRKLKSKMYKEVNEILDELNHSRNLLEDIFKVDGVRSSRHNSYKSVFIHKPWWTPKSKSQKSQVLTAIEEMEKYALVFISCNK
ncbi:14420_t:CDS:2, partial [Racocetra fulgida]